MNLGTIKSCLNCYFVSYIILDKKSVNALVSVVLIQQVVTRGLPYCSD